MLGPLPPRAAAARRRAPIVELDAEDERAIDRALASVREGKGISLDKFRAILQRL
jgi:hypothetical protein